MGIVLYIPYIPLLAPPSHSDPSSHSAANSQHAVDIFYSVPLSLIFCLLGDSSICPCRSLYGPSETAATQRGTYLDTCCCDFSLQAATPKSNRRTILTVNSPTPLGPGYRQISEKKRDIGRSTCGWGQRAPEYFVYPPPYHIRALHFPSTFIPSYTYITV